ncbi:MAG: ABC-type lipoprotein release transport system permease subunit [Myxococcota bacterium]|jgi:ABC-type lipoprotein release transport system permease subunit
MPLAKLLRVVFQNISRSKKNFIFSSIGIIVGISTFTFFIALSEGIQDRVLNRIFPIDQLEIEPIGGVAGAVDENASEGMAGVLDSGPRRMDHRAVEQLSQIEGVDQAFPKMRARFPAKIETGILNRRMAGEGFLEGLEISQTVVDEMRSFEQSCSGNGEDICKRREVSCISSADCPHEGMDCMDGMCRPRAYWRSFQDKHVGDECSATDDCGVRRVCAIDQWIILRTKEKPQIPPVRTAVQALAHPSLDLDFYVATARVGSVTEKDIKDAARSRAEIWTVGSTLDGAAKDALANYPVTIRDFASADEVQAHVDSLPATLTTGVCAGAPCKLEKAEVNIGSWKYFEIYDGHRADCAPRLYCAARNVLSREGRCEPYMPIALNPLMIDFYNANVVSQLGTQPLPNACLVLGLKGYFRLGFSFLRTSMEPVWQRIRWSEIVGFTDKAMHLGGTVPLSYVERLNYFFLGKASVEHYDSVLLQIPRNEAVAGVIEQVQKQSFDLSRNSAFARKAGEMLMIVTLTFLLISIIIILISAMNISHTFLMVVFERQREIGVMRALGATRWDIRKIILLESGLIGLIAGILGNVGSYGVSRLVNLLADNLRTRFPVIPDDFFMYSSTLVVGSIGFALIFCLLGAWVPANRASKLDPAVVLSSA